MPVGLVMSRCLPMEKLQSICYTGLKDFDDRCICGEVGLYLLGNVPEIYL